jgi:hypothetical protein
LNREFQKDDIYSALLHLQLNKKNKVDRKKYIKMFLYYVQQYDHKLYVKVQVLIVQELRLVKAMIIFEESIQINLL